MVVGCSPALPPTDREANMPAAWPKWKFLRVSVVKYFPGSRCTQEDRQHLFPASNERALDSLQWLLLQTLAYQIVGHLASAFLLSFCSGETAIEVVRIGPMRAHYSICFAQSSWANLLLSQLMSSRRLGRVRWLRRCLLGCTTP